MQRTPACIAAVVLAAAGAAAQPVESALEPGFTLRVYQSGEPLSRVVEPLRDQRPNADVPGERMELSGPGDFGGLNAEFVAVATAWFRAEKAGLYTFRLTSDDGSVLMVNGRRAVNNDGLHGAKPAEGVVELAPGLHALRALMFEAKGDESLKFEVKEPGAERFEVADGRWLRREKVGARPVEPGPKKFASGIGDDRAVLVFSKTAGFRHDSIPEGIAMVRALGGADGYEVESTEDAGVFTDEHLARFDCVVFLNTTGDVLSDEQQGAFERYFTKGRGYVGVHSASDTEYDWPFYGEMVGAYFKQHPAIQPAEITVTEPRHASTRHLPSVWSRRDEWYDFSAAPRAGVHRILMLNEGSYVGGAMNGDHPVAWWSEYKGGRSFYSALGHTKESYAEPEFVEHVRRAIEWAAGWEVLSK